MRRLITVVIVLASLFLFGCRQTTHTIVACEWGFTETVNESIPIESVQSDKSTLVGDLEAFVHPCKPIDSFSLGIKDAKTKTHQIEFSLNASYPIREINLTPLLESRWTPVASVSVDVSINGQRFARYISGYALENGGGTIPMNDVNAKIVRLVFNAVENIEFGIQDVRFVLGDGLIVRDAPEWSDAFLRTTGWTGADGIFSFNLNGDDRIGANNPITAFVFSDTFVGSVNPSNYLRLSNKMINNSIGYYDGSHPVDEGLSFDYQSRYGVPESAFLPDSYLGYQPSNLMDGEGLSHSNDPSATLNNDGPGVVWRSAVRDDVSLTIDLMDLESMGSITLWNDNHTPENGASQIELYTSENGLDWQSVGTHELPIATGEPDQSAAASLPLFGIRHRYIRIDLLSNHGGNVVGLGKVLVQSTEGSMLYGEVEATSTDTTVFGNELTGRLWLQDGYVWENRLYLFPLLVKDDGAIFKVTRVGLISTPLVENRLNLETTSYLSTPLMAKTKEGSVITFGAGVMDHRNVDGYVYVYGYIDNPGRRLAVARVLPDQIENFNRWEFYQGDGWGKDITQSIGLIDDVSPELSVTKIDEGRFAGQYMLVAMEGTTSGRISYSLAEHPWGPFQSFHLLYETIEDTYLDKAFTYNAKLHAHLSQPGEYLISYNVNTTKLSALVDARIYYPRFILVTEVKTY